MRAPSHVGRSFNEIACEVHEVLLRGLRGAESGDGMDRDSLLAFVFGTVSVDTWGTVIDLMFKIGSVTRATEEMTTAEAIALIRGEEITTDPTTNWKRRGR
jgi:hypothetical protein